MKITMDFHGKREEIFDGNFAEEILKGVESSCKNFPQISVIRFSKLLNNGKRTKQRTF
jgi:hypothetical protein